MKAVKMNIGSGWHGLLRRPLHALAAGMLGVVLAGIFLTSSYPDGLERVSRSLGFASRLPDTAAPGLQRFTPLAGYRVALVHSSWAGRMVAAGAGVALLYAFGILFGRSLRRKR